MFGNWIDNVSEKLSKSLAGKTEIVTAMCLVCTGCATDAEFIVNTTADLSDLDPGDGICATNAIGNECSLRAAFEETNASIDSLRILITVPAGTYGLTQGSPLPLTRGRASIEGEGASDTIIDGLEQTQILNINAEQAREIIIDGVTLTNGRVGSPNSGGAVYIDSANYLVTFTGTTISNNRAGFKGGGIRAQGSGVLNVINSVLEHNNSTFMSDACNSGGGASGGAAISASGSSVNVIQSELRDNCGSNGAALNLQGGGNHLILRSTLADNLAPNTGAGVFLIGTDARIEDSTIAGNRVTDSDSPWGSAAGLHAIDSDITILSTTIVGNENQFDFDDGAGGIYVDADSTVTARNTILAENNVGARECFGMVSSSGGNFLGETDAECDFDDQPSDTLNGGDPGLGALSFNGGLTRTMLPGATSPLVDAGIDGCENIEQRGLDFPAPKGAACDIGSVER